jgi:serine phosphatase RsbU (regulator of sigma subunit)
MEDAAKKFVRRVLLIHLALLLGVVGVVFFAARGVYDETQAQATKQAQDRQRMFAQQTARGIETSYRSIFSDLDLLRQADKDEDEKAESATAPAKAEKGSGGFDWRQILRLDGPGNGGNAALQTLFSGILWKQLQGRASVLFAVNKDRLKDKNFERGLDRFPTVQLIGSDDPNLTPQDVILNAEMHKWLLGVTKPQISPYVQHQVNGRTFGYNLVCVPVSAKNSRLLVAVVKVDRAQARFTPTTIGDGDSTNAFLCDEGGTIMISSNAALIGREVESLKEDELREIARRYVGKGKQGVETIDHHYSLAGQDFPPSMVAIEPVGVAGTKWSFMVTTSLADVDAVVDRVFKRAIFWAVFVVASMTALLLSTAVQLIRARARTEQFKNDLLTKELTQAREIQLAWLPRQGISVPTMDIAAVNQPASHISGDFYNWFDLPDGRTVVTIGDVTGHGLSAAFLMATTQLLVHTTMLRLEDPGRTLTEVNRQLCLQGFNGQFVTMLVCVIDTEGQTLEVATAGHYPPILGTHGDFEQLGIEPQLVLGVDRDQRYPTERFTLPDSASLVLYTDGVLDAQNPDGKRFDLKRIIGSVKGHAESAQALVDSLVGHINQFRGTRVLPDDLTLVCVQMQGQSSFKPAEAVSV